MDCLLARSFATESFLAIFFLLQLLFNSFVLKNLKYNFPVLNRELFLQTFFIFICLILIVLNLKLETFFYNFIFIKNSSIYFFKIIILFFSVFSLIIIYKSGISQTINELEFISIFLLVILSSFLLISSYDLLSVYLALEMQSLCFYALASFKKNSAASVESGLKYFILGSVVSCFFLLSISLLYGCFGTLNINDLLILLSFNIDNDFFNLNLLFFFSSLCFLCVLLFKIGAFPFHWWQPDVYEGSPLSSTVIFVMLPKIIFLGFLIKFIFIFGRNFSIINDFLLLSGILTVFFGAMFSIQQKRLKRFFLFSSIAQVGFLVVALASNFIDSYSSIYFFLVAYLVSSGVIWGLYSILFSSQITINSFFEITNTQLFLASLKNLLIKNKTLAFSFLIIFFSLAGIPPLWGFFAKLFIFLELFKNSYFFSSGILVLISAVSVYYYIRVVKIVFFESSKETSHYFSFIEDNSILSLNYVFLSFGLVLTIILFLAPDLLLIFLQKLTLGLVY